jgi:hypothetical protein
MGELLRDSIWTFVGAVIAVAAIIVSILIYLGQKQRKRLRVERIAGVPLARVGSQGIDGLQITYKGKSLDRPSIVLARISNPGNAPIRRADFEAPITLEFDQNTELLEASVVETQPSGIPASAEIKGSSAILSPHLLNSGDVVVMRIFLAAGGSKFTPFARIAGVGVIETRAGTSLWPPILGLLGVLIMGAAITFSPAPMSAQIMELRTDEIPYAVVSVFGSLLMMGVLIRDLVTRVARIRDRLKVLA